MEPDLTIAHIIMEDGEIVQVICADGSDWDPVKTEKVMKLKAQTIYERKRSRVLSQQAQNVIAGIR